MSDTFDQGWAARPFKEQFPELSDKEADHLDKINHAITIMLIADLITDSQRDAIRMKRFPKLVSKVVNAARKRAARAARTAQKGKGELK